MDLKWTRSATSDLPRLHRPLAPFNAAAAARAVQALVAAPSRLLTQPRMGRRLEEIDPREVRRILMGRYEMRHEIPAGQAPCVADLACARRPVTLLAGSQAPAMEGASPTPGLVAL